MHEDQYRELSKESREEAESKGIFFAGDYNGKDSISYCDNCQEDFMMSELTCLHREDGADEFWCGVCLLGKIS